jgi:tripartite-type tricarboxylate transporter receptor subunit TctC
MTFRTIFGLGLTLAAVGATAAEAEDFYAGKQIHLLVGTENTGTFDLHGRALARHMGKHIPGNPTFVVQNISGAASIKMTNFMYTTAPKDGTYFGTGQGQLTTAPLSTPAEATYDPTKFSWIGSSTRDTFVGFVWHTAPLQKFEDAFTTPVVMGGSAVGTFSIDSALLANAMFGTQFKIIIGYKSSAETKLAVEKGEVQGVMGTNWNSLRTQKDWMDGNKIRLFVQYGLQKDPQFPTDLPLFIDFAKTEQDKQVAKFWVSNLEHGKPFFGPPGMPADRLAILRKAFDETMKDPEYLQDLAALGETQEGPMTGEALAKLVAEEMQTPPAQVQRMKDIVQKYLKEGAH